MWAAQFVMFLTGRFFATFAMNVGFQFTVELMPTCLRGQGIALANVMAMVSQMTSPFIVYSVNLTLMLLSFAINVLIFSL